jgi:hypothetical protein
MFYVFGGERAKKTLIRVLVVGRYGGALALALVYTVHGTILLYYLYVLCYSVYGHPVGVDIY